jgi:hypothetical protein
MRRVEWPNAGSSPHHQARVAQLAEAFGLGPKGCRFDSYHGYFELAAQMAPGAKRLDARLMRA